MLDHAIHRVLRLSPQGVSSDQLLWRLRSAGIRVDAAEILATLKDLVASGEICRGRGRWRVSLRPRFDPVQAPLEKVDTPRDVDMLPAVPARIARSGPGPTDIAGAEGPRDPGKLPDWCQLLRYYAATQRQDPRGQISQFPDLHGTGWQLFHVVGTWWWDASLLITVVHLPDSFPQALSQRGINVAAIGWPLFVLQDGLGTRLLPALILPVSWSLDGHDLTVNFMAERPVINPDWLREACRRTSWTADKLREHLFPEGEPDDLAAVSQRLRHGLSTLGSGGLRPGELDEALNLKREGFANAAAIFLPDERSFTQGVARDLETLCDWTPEQRGATALGALLEPAGSLDSDRPAMPVVVTEPLSESQFDAAEAALGGPVTLIQGPPGTGKSQVITSLVVSALIEGAGVLVAARNHRALDEIEERLVRLLPDLSTPVRGRDAEGERDTSFLDALREIANGPTATDEERRTAETARRDAAGTARAAAGARDAARELRRLHVALSDLASRVPAPRTSAEPSQAAFLALLARLLRALRRWARPALHDDPAAPLPEEASLRELRERMAELRRAIAEMDGQSTTIDSTDEAAVEWKQAADLLRKVVGARIRADETQRLALAHQVKELEFQEQRQVGRMPDSAAIAVVAHRPVWAVSTLSVPARLPLMPALFDYVVFDEASQCDIASALPLLARARHAVIVGDPEQLAFVPSLSIASEHALMDAAGLPREGRSVIAQSYNSLFEFVSARPGVERRFLSDQFRSTPEIVDYIGQEFYSGRLRWRSDDDARFRVPAGYRAGITWDDVAGRTSRQDGGNVNEVEAERCVALLRRLAEDADFQGSVGVITSFNAQVALIQRKVHAGLTAAQRERLALKLGTVDKWQGGEADVMLFSLVLAPGAAQSARTFLQRERRRINVAISRARALCIIVGDLAFASRSGIRHIQHLAKRATRKGNDERLPYDSLWERRLATALKARGLDPKPQHPVGRRYLDLAIIGKNVRLDIEVDGRRWHEGPDGERKVADHLRDIELTARGWIVLRFWVHEIEQDMESCVDRIERHLV